jgi:diguanylate cyclase (GGDEF)-like protein
VRKFRTNSGRTRYLTFDEEVKLFEKLQGQEWVQRIVTMAINTGMRQGEIFDLTWFDVDLSRGLLHVRFSKNGKDRFVPINQTVRRMLEGLPRTSEYVFPSPKTEGRLIDIKSSFDKAKKEAGIRDFRFHDLRHTAATRMADGGADAFALAEIFGWSDVRMSLRYTHATDEAKRRAEPTEITDEKRGELLLRLEHNAARALAVAADAAAGVRGVMRAICEGEGLPCGRYFALDADAGVLRLAQAWHVSDPDIERFVEGSRDLTYQMGAGLTGAVWQSGEPRWTADVQQDPRASARPLAEASGIRGVFAFPAISEGKVLGVLTFSSKDAREPDERLLQSARVVGGQVGQFLRGKQAEEFLRESEARFRSLTQMSSDFFWETDAEHRVSLVQHGPGYAPTIPALVGKTRWEIPSVSPDEHGWAQHRALLDKRQPFRDFEFGRATPEGTRYLSISGEPRFGSGGRYLGYRGVGRDVTEIALARERIATLAYSDPLTGLANRASLGPSLEQAVQRARRRGSKLALVFLDLDGFKEVNDLHGHGAGDALLVEVAERLRAHLRASDLVVRLGGDEFLVVLEEVQDLAPVETVARKLLGEMRRAFALPGAEVGVTASIGISVFPDDAVDGAALMKHADTAMYAAKQAGKNCLAFYTAGPAANEATDSVVPAQERHPRGY